MSRYISVKWLEDNAKEYSLGYYDYDEYAVPLSALDEAPSIDIVRCKMSDLMREQMFAQWLISKTLALYMTQDDFREEVNSKVNDGYTFSINGEKMNIFEQTEWKLHLACVDIARQFTEYYFNDFIADEAEQTENSSEKPNNSTISKMEQVQ